MTTAMILAAGRGTRLQPLTDTVPKPMLHLAGVPLIEHQVRALAAAGVRKLVINLHHLGEQIEAHLGDGATYGLQIIYSREEALLETGGGIVNALQHLGRAPFWLLNGDIWTDFDFGTLPQDLGTARAHLVLTPCPEHRTSGDFECAHLRDDYGPITGRGDAYVYCGIAVLHPALFAHRGIEHFSLREVFFELIEARQITAQIHRGLWHDIGSLEQYEALAADPRHLP